MNQLNTHVIISGDRRRFTILNGEINVKEAIINSSEIVPQDVPPPRNMVSNKCLNNPVMKRNRSLRRAKMHLSLHPICLNYAAKR